MTTRRLLLAGMCLLMVISACDDEPAGPNDVSPPGRVTDLSVAPSGTNRLVLEWTAPGDDGTYGLATSYEIRRSGVAITEENFEYATIIGTPPPESAGTAQQFVVAGIDTLSELHFALRAVDEVGNVSKVSADAGWMVRFEKSLAAVGDNTMYEESPDSSNGRGRYFFCGTAADTLVARRALIAFPIGQSLPATAIIDSVDLRLHLSGDSGDSSPRAVSLRRVMASWGEGASNALEEEETGAKAETNDATWTYRLYRTLVWATEGGDYDVTASAQASIASTGYYTWASSRMRSDVQGWLATPSQNYGWILIGDESVEGTARRFDSRQHPTPGNQPRLRVFYTIRSLTTTKVTP
ncbi:MAG TPA: DNRLRE domain-containing protein [Candidatus Krumholzibacteria bacterium]